MMSAAVFRAKFSVPSPPACYRARPRLDALWRRHTPARLVTVTAGAGWGKTCFLAARARRLGGRALWYTLDDLDRDPTVLAAHLMAACDLRRSDAPPLEQLARIIGALDQHRLLVLDDVQTIAQADHARDFLSRLLRYLPPSCQLVLAAREQVALRDAGLETRGEAVRLETADLAFTAGESREFLRRRLGRPGAEPIAARVHELTEGWPAGLEIVCQALAETEPATHPAVLGRLEAGHGRWFEFFVDEVLSDLDSETRDFLLQTSVLPHLEPDLCDHLLDRDDSARVLGRLAAGGLFTVPVGDHAWRYHNLLRGCLHHRLERDLGPRERRRALRRAAKLLAAEGEPEAAVLDLVRHDDSDGAASLITQRVNDLIASRRPETLDLALELLPESKATEQPAVLLVRACQAQLQGRWGRAEADLRRALCGRGSVRVQSAIRARLVRLHLQRGHWESCLRSGRRALQASPALSLADRGNVLAAMGVAAASLGRLKAGAAHLEEALSIARRRRDRVLQGRCLFLLAANVHFIQGDLERALDTATRARDLFRELDRGDLECHATGVLGFVLAGLGREAEAREISLWALQRAEAIGYRLIAGYARLTLGECDLLAGDPTAAAARFDEAREIAADLGEEALLDWTVLGLAEAAWRREEPEQALALAERALDLAERRGDSFCEARALAHRGRALASTRPRAARTSWDRAARILTAMESNLERSRLQLWRATEAGGATLAATVAEIAVGPHAQVLLSQRGAPGDEMVVCQDSGAGAGGRTSLTLRCLGPLEIDRDGKELVRGAWRSRRARRLLNILIGARCDPVPRDRVLELLWPEGDPEKTAGNLRQAVFQLRRILEPPDTQDPVFIHTDGDNLRLDLGVEGQADLLVFERALGRARDARRRGRFADELAALTVALDLWRGPYLADTPYDLEVDEIAAGLRQGFLRAAGRALELLTATARWDDLVTLARRAQAEDPLHEPFTLALLTGLLHLGHRQEVREVYSRFEARLVRELDLLPSARLKEIAEAAAGTAA